MAMGTHGAKVLILCPSNWPKPIKYIWGCIFAILFWGGGGDELFFFYCFLVLFIVHEFYFFKESVHDGGIKRRVGCDQ